MDTVYSLSGDVPPLDPALLVAEDSSLQPGALIVGSIRQLCLIRKISAGGAVLHADLPVEEGQRLELELETGEQLDGIIAWKRGLEFGLRFEARIDILPILARNLASQPGERRRMPRVEIAAPALIETADGTELVTVRDIAQGGSRIETPHPLTLDARIVLHGAAVGDSDLPLPAIRPYPVQYVGSWTLRDGPMVTIRPIRPEDEPLLTQFHQNLSDRTVYLRYFQYMRFEQRVSHERLTRICFIDYDRQMALVAEQQDPAAGEPAILGVARLIKTRTPGEMEFAVLVADQYQGRGLGSQLLERVIQFARDEGMQRITGSILAENVSMQALCKRLGFVLRHEDGPVLRADLNLPMP